MNKIYLRALQGTVLSTGAPLGWLIINYCNGSGIYQELQQNPMLYSYMLFGTMAVFIGFGIHVGRYEQLITSLAFKDALTRIYNLRYFRERLKDEVANSHRYHHPLSLIYFDLDFFKKINDQYGHPAGDKVLRSIANTIKKTTRINDVFARVGGEEFAVLLPRCDLANARLNAERIRSSVEKLNVTYNRSQTINITVSAGVVCLTENETAKALYGRADKNLYSSKQAGRNQVTG